MDNTNLPTSPDMEEAREAARRIADVARTNMPNWRAQLLEEDIEAVARFVLSSVPAAPDGWCFDMGKAPRDNTLLQLLLEHDDGDEDGCGGGFDDAEQTRTMGFNNFDNDGIDEWKFPGWSWCHDCITEQGCGRPIAWALMLPLPSPPAKEE